MPITAPKHSLIATRISQSDFVLCQDFVFRPANVDGFSHQRFDEGAAMTTVNFKSYTQSIPDPECRFWNFYYS